MTNEFLTEHLAVSIRRGRGGHTELLTFSARSKSTNNILLPPRGRLGITFVDVVSRQQGRHNIQDIRKMMREHSQQFIHKEGIANYLRTRTARRGVATVMRRPRIILS